MNLTVTDARLDLTNGTWLCLKIQEAVPAKRFILEKKNRLYDLELKEHREKRSLDANSYCWALMDKLAKEVGSTKNEIYRLKVREVGPYKDFTLTEDEARTFRAAWEKIGEAWLTEQLDFDQDGDRLVIRAYYGSSTYNTKQMSRLIDSVVEDCRAVGIETQTDRELSLLKEDWKHAPGD